MGSASYKHDAANDFIEQPFYYYVPIGDRPIVHVNERNIADIGVGLRTKLELVGVSGEPDVKRQNPQFLQHLQNPGFRRDRQRKNHEINARAPAELQQIVDAAEFALAGAVSVATVVATIVE